jgi:hypothetical protein
MSLIKKLSLKRLSGLKLKVLTEMYVRLSSNKNKLAQAKEKIVKNLLHNAISHRLRQIAMEAIA